MTTWPQGIRDTTKFPEVDISVSTELRPHLDAFVNLEGVDWNDYDEQRRKSGLEVNDSRLRTYRKMYEVLGLLYPKDGKIRLSSLGLGIVSIQTALEKKKIEILESAAKSAIDTLSRYQFKNPVDDAGNLLPENFDIFPFVAIWRAMDMLDGKLHPEELNRVLMRVERMADLPAALDRIGRAREALGSYVSATDEAMARYLGERVASDQPPARMAAFFSLAGWGGLIISLADQDGFRSLTPYSRRYVSAVLERPPQFFRASNEQDWFEHYLGPQAVRGAGLGTDENLSEVVSRLQDDFARSNLISSSQLQIRFLASILAKRFLILTGLSGSGKTKLAHAFAAWISESEEQYRLVAVGADWTTNENIVGYQDALNPKLYRKPSNGALDILLRANEELKLAKKENKPARPYFLILDEMNLSHVERYFADILSAIESGQEIALHSGAGELSASEDDPLLVPKKIRLPDNLFIIGTVNVDETTYMFSPKVLDRANVIEFRATADDIVTFLDAPAKVNMEALAGKGAEFGQVLIAEAGRGAELDVASARDLKYRLTELFDSLAEIGAEFGFRTAYEITRFVHFHKKLSGDGWQFKDALDAQVVQKLMPKLHGSERKLGPVLEALDGFCREHKCEISQVKIKRMRDRLKTDGFTSFAEA